MPSHSMALHAVQLQALCCSHTKQMTFLILSCWWVLHSDTAFLLAPQLFQHWCVVGLPCISFSNWSCVFSLPWPIKWEVTFMKISVIFPKRLWSPLCCTVRRQEMLGSRWFLGKLIVSETFSGLSFSWVSLAEAFWSTSKIYYKGVWWFFVFFFNPLSYLCILKHSFPTE